VLVSFDEWLRKGLHGIERRRRRLGKGLLELLRNRFGERGELGRVEVEAGVDLVPTVGGVSW
jgi:hypothetical protein